MQPHWQAVWRMCLSTCKRGVQRGATPLAGVWGCSPALASGESRGVQPHWQAAWRMCLHTLLLFTFPLPSRKGPRGMVRAPKLKRSPRKQGVQRGITPLAGGMEDVPQHVQAGSPEGNNPTGKRYGGVPPHVQTGSPEGRNPSGRRYGGVPPHVQAGSPEGRNPSGKRYGGCASITYFSLLSPFLPRRGPGGWSEPHIEAQPPQAGRPEGCNPTGRGLGVSTIILHPTLPEGADPCRIWITPKPSC